MNQSNPNPESITDEAFNAAYLAMTKEHFHFTLVVDSFGQYFLSIAFLPLLTAAELQALYGDRIQPQIIKTSSMDG